MFHWGAYAISNYFAKEHGELIDRRMRRWRERANDPRIALVDRVRDLEDDLGRALLLLHALTETCLRAGVMSPEQLSQIAAELDKSDGVEDGRLDPATLRPEQDTPPDTSTEEYLRRLETEG
jgi:hypothetical protein